MIPTFEPMIEPADNMGNTTTIGINATGSKRRNQLSDAYLLVSHVKTRVYGSCIASPRLLRGRIPLYRASDRKGITLSDVELRCTVNLTHATGDRYTAFMLKRRGKLSGPKHEVLAGGLLRELLPELRIQCPFRQEFMADSIQLGSRPNLIRRKLNFGAPRAQHLRAGQLREGVRVPDRRHP